MSNTTNLRITPKRLGQIEMDKFCPSCYWYLLKQKFRPPFNFFGGAIFRNMEMAEMAVVGHLLEKDGKLPPEFAPFCDLVERVDYPRDWRRFKYLLDSGVELYGEPDDIFKVSDGSIAVIDHKTAQPKGTEDPFLPCYEVQVTGYAFIAEMGLDLGEVSKGGLFYWGAQHESVAADPGRFYRNGLLTVPFAPKPLNIDIDYTRLDGPLETAMELWDATTPPDGAEKCKDCKALRALFAIETEIGKLQDHRDQTLLSQSGFSSWAKVYVLKQKYARNSARTSALRDLMNEKQQISFAPDGMVSGWEVFHDHGF